MSRSLAASLSSDSAQRPLCGRRDQPIGPPLKIALIKNRIERG
jgi:hypothetical protein